jgi:hypothetical protein
MTISGTRAARACDSPLLLSYDTGRAHDPVVLRERSHQVQGSVGQEARDRGVSRASAPSISTSSRCA